MNKSEQINELAKALATAQRAIEGAVKGNVNPAFRSRYADLGAVWDAIREPMTASGISIIQQLSTDENRVACTTILMHSSGQWIEFPAFTVPVSKQDAQGYGSAATYCRRYSLMAAVGIAPIDDDGEAAVGRGTKKEAKPAEPPPPAVSPERAAVVRRVADSCIAHYAKDDEFGTYEEASAITDPEERVLLWSMLHDHSKVRSCIKRIAELERNGSKVTA